jgi:hypothetical protein
MFRASFDSPDYAALPERPRPASALVIPSWSSAMFAQDGLVHVSEFQGNAAV